MWGPEAGAWRDTPPAPGLCPGEGLALPGPQVPCAVGRSGVVLTPGREGVCSAAAAHGLLTAGAAAVAAHRASCSARVGLPQIGDRARIPCIARRTLYRLSPQGSRGLFLLLFSSFEVTFVMR